MRLGSLEGDNTDRDTRTQQASYLPENESLRKLREKPQYIDDARCGDLASSMSQESAHPGLQA